MSTFEQDFVDLLVDFEVVRFGDFTLKSGRSSPYFVNFGQIRTGAAIARLGKIFAAKLNKHGIACDLVFGPAYKGIPLAVATAAALSTEGRDVGYAFDRKEVKDHGEGGVFVGTTPHAGMRVVVVDDVITSGMSIREAVHLLRAVPDLEIDVLVGVDRQERGPRGTRPTVQELRDELGVRVLPVVDIRALVHALRGTERGMKIGLDDARIEAIRRHLEEHGGA